MDGYVGITDFDWFQFLAARAPWDEINFWQPRPRNLLDPRPGMPFFFKLKAQHGSPIVGFAYFAWRTTLPAWMAWDTFEEANGAESKSAMLSKIIGLRRDENSDRAGSFEIGCLILAEPTFFPREQWVRGPSDWSAAIQRGKGYALDRGEGERILRECQERASRARAVQGEETAPHLVGIAGGSRERFGTPALVRPRLGQRAFRAAITDVYGRRCAISSEHSLPVLEAAHIRPYSEGGEHALPNGLLLRADLHRLLDGGYVTVTPKYEFLVSKRLHEEFANGRVYYELEAQVRAAGGIHLPRHAEHRPDPKYLEWHADTRFAR